LSMRNVTVSLCPSAAFFLCRSLSYCHPPVICPFARVHKFGGTPCMVDWFPNFFPTTPQFPPRRAIFRFLEAFFFSGPFAYPLFCLVVTPPSALFDFCPSRAPTEPWPAPHFMSFCRLDCQVPPNLLSVRSFFTRCVGPRFCSVGPHLTLPTENPPSPP